MGCLAGEAGALPHVTQESQKLKEETQREPWAYLLPCAKNTSQQIGGNLCEIPQCLMPSADRLMQRGCGCCFPLPDECHAKCLPQPRLSGNREGHGILEHVAPV